MKSPFRKSERKQEQSVSQDIAQLKRELETEVSIHTQTKQQLLKFQQEVGALILQHENTKRLLDAELQSHAADQRQLQEVQTRNANLEEANADYRAYTRAVEEKRKLHRKIPTWTEFQQQKEEVPS